MSRIRLNRFREKGSCCDLARLVSEAGSSHSSATWVVGDALGVLHKTIQDAASGPSGSSRIQKLASHGELFEEAILALSSSGSSGELALAHGHEVTRRRLVLMDAAADADLGQAFRGTHDITHLQYDSSGKNL
jgi:hypothetical protein